MVAAAASSEDEVAASDQPGDVHPIRFGRAVGQCPAGQRLAAVAVIVQQGVDTVGQPRGLGFRRAGPRGLGQTGAPLGDADQRPVLAERGEDVVAEVLDEPQRPAQQGAHRRLRDSAGPVF
jgi:hypothetical protein